MWFMQHMLKWTLFDLLVVTGSFTRSGHFPPKKISVGEMCEIPFPFAVSRWYVLYARGASVDMYSEVVAGCWLVSNILYFLSTVLFLDNVQSWVSGGGGCLSIHLWALIWIIYEILKNIFSVTTWFIVSLICSSSCQTVSQDEQILFRNKCYTRVGQGNHKTPSRMTASLTWCVL